MKFKRNTILQTACGTPAVRPRDQDDLHDDAHPKGENSAKRQKTSEYEAYVFGESSSGQMMMKYHQSKLLGILYNRLNSVSIIVSYASTGRGFII
ncbi:hypothetical protein Tco_0346930, partial [Tanacetum coccineum]